eukprot:5944439-Alexandrium_andersonii.AAC.1
MTCADANLACRGQTACLRVVVYSTCVRAQMSTARYSNSCSPLTIPTHIILKKADANRGFLWRDREMVE